MREGWEYKKLGEIGKIVTGSTPTTKDETNYYPQEYNFVKPSDLSANGITKIDMTEFYVSSKGLMASRSLPAGCVLVSCIGSIGKVGILSKKACCNQQINAVIPTEDIDSRYLAYAIISMRYKLEAIANAPVVPIINKTNFSKLLVPVPPETSQLTIVSELDQINDLIRLKKEQLKEYDNLAQSIFYDMFGDPVENEKGWEVKPLGEFGLLGRGVSKHRPRNAPELLGGTMPLVQTGDVANSGMYLTEYNSTYSDLGVAQSKIWEKGTLCITIAATIGKCAILSFRACFPDSVVGFLCHENICTNVYMYFIFSCLQKILEEEAPAVAQKNINLKILNGLMIPLPPLPLQQEFSFRIEQIEKLKTEVQKTITDLETLLASRMQYWFE